MVTLARPTLEQEIRLDAVAIDGCLAATNIVATRARGVAGALTGIPVEEVPQILSTLFPLCGIAHAVAALTAIEAALRVAVSPAQRAFWELMLLAEHGAALAWRILMDWPVLLGEPPQTRVCAEIRRAASALSDGTEHVRWTTIGGAHLRFGRRDLQENVSTLARMLLNLFPGAADPVLTWNELQRAIASGRSTAARLITIARNGVMSGYGRHDGPLLPPVDADWFAARLISEPDFSDAPTLDGMPTEVGALAAKRHPLIADALSDWGPTLATRLLAAALDASVVAKRLLAALDELSDDDPVAADLTQTGRGAAVVETARGPLAYCIDVAAGRVEAMRSVAPTEWNFHANGPFMAALIAAPRVPDPLFAARLLAASFDPCVPFSIHLSSDRRPPIGAELTLHA